MQEPLELHAEFLRQPSKVDEIIKFLGDMAKSNKMEGTKEKKVEKEVDISADVTDYNFLALKRTETTDRKSFFSRSSRKSSVIKSNTNQMTFMRQIDISDEERKKARRERIHIATSFRRLGNAEYRKTNYDQAIKLYSQGLNYIVDSPVLYVNRSLCYIKKREYKRALIDLDYVLNQLDSNCVQALLYKAGALKRMNNEDGFEECVANARRYNRSKSEYIDYFLDKMRTDF
ncbi:tetratricopeptide repeat protein 12-like [Drosophila sulfurigaster albostrigata]|uniref:tetratricopeptide repeat protein 12-like n=1 Tax=Drosophila sulfurigaster albostrigata TaxID=89887 RepID=UPI002D21A548|nr:tetratricopeptide repeat protein 12-like [Drosophila sulfurigaster albostrigata]